MDQRLFDKAKEMAQADKTLDLTDEQIRECVTEANSEYRLGEDEIVSLIQYSGEQIMSTCSNELRMDGNADDWVDHLVMEFEERR